MVQPGISRLGDTMNKFWYMHYIGELTRLDFTDEFTDLYSNFSIVLASLRELIAMNFWFIVGLSQHLF